MSYDYLLSLCVCLGGFTRDELRARILRTTTSPSIHHLDTPVAVPYPLSTSLFLLSRPTFTVTSYYDHHLIASYYSTSESTSSPCQMQRSKRSGDDPPSLPVAKRRATGSCSPIPTSESLEEEHVCVFTCRARFQTGLTPSLGSEPPLPPLNFTYTKAGQLHMRSSLTTVLT